VCVFAVLWLPYRAYVVYNSFAAQRYENLWFLLFCRLMVYTNSAINPILYNAMSVKFCRAFRRLLMCGRTAPGGGSGEGSTTAAGGPLSVVGRSYGSGRTVVGCSSSTFVSSAAHRHHHHGHPMKPYSLISAPPPPPAATAVLSTAAFNSASSFSPDPED
jgi:thyrotropin-releasing hormone receptor